jgi:fimbrial chaperone protein
MIMANERMWLRAIMGAAIVGSCMWALTLTATAATLRLAPVRIEVAPNKQFCSLSVSNDGKEPAIVQIRGYGWTKDKDGNDLLDHASGPAVNPSIVNIPAGETRLIRCSLPNRAGPVEESYRLIIDELPGANPAPGTVKTLLRISIPLFRAPAGAAPAPAWSMEKAGDGATWLVVANRGNRHAQVSALILHPHGPQTTPVRVAQAFYLLAGGQAKLLLPSPPPSGIAAVELETTQGRLPASPLSAGKGAD